MSGHLNSGPAADARALDSDNEWEADIRFFTRAWHGSDLGEEEEAAVTTAYERHRESLMPLLPLPVRLLASGLNLHDGLIRRIEVDRSVAHVRLGLVIGDLATGYYALELAYSGVAIGGLDVEQIRRLATDPAVEILYDEVDVAEPGVYVHRLLFWPYYELDIAFSGLSLVISPRAEGRKIVGPGKYVDVHAPAV